MGEKREKSSSKSGTLAVLCVLNNYSSDSQRLTQKAIIDKVREDYGLELDRKTVSRTIEMLKNFGTETRFEFNIQSDARHGTCIRKDDSVEKITLMQAIRRGKRVLFQQFVHDFDGNIVANDKDSHPNGMFEVDPYAIVRSMGQDYLVCHKEGDGNSLRNLRISRIRRVEVLKKQRLDIKKIEGFEKDGFFNHRDYEKKFNYHMFSGKPELVEFMMNDAPPDKLKSNFNTVYSELSGFDELRSRQLPSGKVQISCHMPRAGAKIFALQFAELCTLVWPLELRRELGDLFAQIGANYREQGEYGKR